MHPLASKVLFSFSEFRIVQSVRPCCMTEVMFPPGWERKCESESTDYLVMTNYEVPNWSWRLCVWYDECLCSTKGEYENLGIFIIAKNQGSWLHVAQYGLCATHLRAQAQLSCGWSFKEHFSGLEMNLQSQGLFSFCKVQIMLILMALLAQKMLRLPKCLKRTQLEEEALYAWNRTRIFFILYKEWLSFYT